MRGHREAVRHLAALVFVLGLLTGSFQPSAAQDAAPDDSDATGDGVSSIAALQAELYSDVSFSVTAMSPYMIDTLPAGTVWTIAGTADSGEDVDLSGTTDTDLAVPTSFLAATDVPYGTYVMTFDPPNLGFVSNGVVVDGPETTIDVALFPLEGTESTVTLNLSSSDPDLASTLPDNAHWVLSLTDGGVVAEGGFGADQLALPVSIALDTAVPYGDYLLTVAATPAFQPFEQVFTIGTPDASLDAVLDPYVEQPVETWIRLVMDDGSEADVHIHLTITDVDTEEVIVDEEMDRTLPTTLWADYLMPGEYWIVISPAGDYLAISQAFTVTPRVPSETFEYSLIALGPDLDPTETPTDVPTETATDGPDETGGSDDAGQVTTGTTAPTTGVVTTLPSTGQGMTQREAGNAPAMMLASVVLAAMAAVVLLEQRRRTR